MRKTEEKTLNYYDEHAKEWAEAHHGFDEESFWKDWMEKLHKLLPNGKVLEIGSGSGKDASNLLRLGYEYIGTDASKGLLEVAKRRSPNGVFKNIRVQDLKDNFNENEFDGFWTAATLLHVPKDEIDQSLQNIHFVVRDGGIGFISVKQGEGESEDVETGRLFSYYSQDEFTDVLKRNGLEILEKDILTKEPKTWLVYLLKVKK